MIYAHRRLVRGYLRQQWRWFSLIIGLTLLSSALATLQPWPMKLLVDYALSDAALPKKIQAGLSPLGMETTPGLLVVVAGLAVLALWALSSAVNLGLSFAWTIAGQQMVNNLAGDVFSRLQRLSLRFHRRHDVGDALSRLSEDTSVVASVANNLLLGPLQNAATLGAMLWIGFLLDPMLACVVFALAPLLALSSHYFGQRLKQRARLGRESKSRLMSFVHQTLRNVPLVQTFGTQSRHTSRFRELAADAVDLSQRGQLLGSSYGLVNGLISTSGIAIVLFVGGMRVLSDAIPLGTLLVFLAYVRRMQDSSSGLFKVFTKLKVAEASLERIGEVLDSQEFVPEASQPTVLPALPHSDRGHIHFENVTFGYENSRPVLHEITLEVRPGETVAIVGSTGAGKSTLVSLVPRFFDPWQGRVTLEGIDLRELALNDVRSQVSVLLQEPLLLPLTVAENIAFGHPGATRAEVIAAAEQAQADAFIRQLPDGYDTPLAEGGKTLSGGQRQRIATARAFLRDAPILILDEPTSAVDVETEARLTDILRQLMRQRTTLVIAHRLSTIRHADRIVVLEQGRIVESGTHEALLAERGSYWSFSHRQSRPPREAAVA